MRGEVAIGPLLYNSIYPKQQDGAPIEIFFPPEGVPINPYAAGIPKTADASQRRQAVPELVPVEGRPDLHDQGARQSHLAEGAAGLSRRASIPRWSRSGCPKFDEYEKLHATWVEDWNKTFGYRQ